MGTESWAVKRLEAITDGFGSEDLKQMVSYAITLPDNELTEYFLGILGNTPDVSQFIADLIEKKKPKSLKGAWKSSARDPLLYLSETLSHLTDSERKAMIDQAKQMPREAMNSYFVSLLGDSEPTRRFLLQFQGLIEKEKSQKANQEHQKNPSKSKKKKKSMPIEKVGNHPLRQGRVICECQATVHELVTNCLDCGKIVCAFEGDMICPWCGISLKRSNSTSDDLLQVAQDRKDTLLEFDRNSTARTHVTDIATDFDVGADQFNKWLTPEQRALALKKQKELERLQEEQKQKRVITIDLENNRVVLENPKDIILQKEEKKKVEYVGHFRNPNLNKPQPKFIATIPTKKTKVKEQLVMDRLRDDIFIDSEF